MKEQPGRYSESDYRVLHQDQHKWRAFLSERSGEPDAFKAFKREHPPVADSLLSMIRRTQEGEIFEGDAAALAGADLRRMYLMGVNLRGADLRGADLRGALLNEANLSDADLRGAQLEGARMVEAKLCDARLDGAHLDQAVMHRADFTGANLPDALLVESRLESGRLGGTDLSRTHFNVAILRHAHLWKANLEDADLRASDAVAADFQGANLRGAKIQEADLTSAKFRRASISAATSLGGVVFEPSHQAQYDHTDTLVISAWDRLFNWGALRAIGRFPLFGVSTVALAASLIVINAIGYANEHVDATVLSEWIDYPIPLPDRMTWLLISSLLLVVGTSIYELACPTRVKEMSETEWVDQHGHPRLKYLAEVWRNRVWQYPTLVFTGLGGVLGLALLGERVIAALQYILGSLG